MHHEKLGLEVNQLIKVVLLQAHENLVNEHLS